MLAHKYRNKLCTLGLGCLSNLSCGSRVNISVNFSHYISHNQSCVYIQCSQPAHRAQSKSSKAGTEWLAGNKKPFRLTRGIIIQGVMSTGEQPRIKDYVAPYHQENLRMSGSLCHPGSKLNFILEKINETFLWHLKLSWIKFIMEKKKNLELVLKDEVVREGVLISLKFHSKFVPPLQIGSQV